MEMIFRLSNNHNGPGYYLGRLSKALDIAVKFGATGVFGRFNVDPINYGLFHLLVEKRVDSDVLNVLYKELNRGEKTSGDKKENFLGKRDNAAQDRARKLSEVLQDCSGITGEPLKKNSKGKVVCQASHIIPRWARKKAFRKFFKNKLGFEAGLLSNFDSDMFLVPADPTEHVLYDNDREYCTKHFSWALSSGRKIYEEGVRQGLINRDLEREKLHKAVGDVFKEMFVL